MLRSKFTIAILSVFMLAVLWPATMVAAPPSQETAPVFSAYEWSDKTGPSACPAPPVFVYGTRTVYNYSPIGFEANLYFGIIWYELDADGNVIGDEPIAATTFDVKSGDAVPYGSISFNQNVSGIVGVMMMASEDGKEWVNVANGVYVIAGDGAEELPEPGECPL